MGTSVDFYPFAELSGKRKFKEKGRLEQSKRMMHELGFEPRPPKREELESSALDRSAIRAVE
jgi:hypothetical protein